MKAGNAKETVRRDRRCVFDVKGAMLMLRIEYC